jgi:hypothetical protein
LDSGLSEKPRLAKRIGYGLAGVFGRFKFERARLLIDGASLKPADVQAEKLKRAAKLLERVCENAGSILSLDPARLKEAGGMLVGVLERLKQRYEETKDVEGIARTFERKADAHNYLRIAFLRLDDESAADDERWRRMECLAWAAAGYGELAEQSADHGLLVQAHERKFLAHSALAGEFRNLGAEDNAGKEALAAAREAISAAKELEGAGSGRENVFNAYKSAECELVNALSSFLAYTKNNVWNNPADAARTLLLAADTQDLVSFVSSRMAFLTVHLPGHHEAYQKRVDYEKGRRMRGRARELMGGEGDWE